MKQKRFMGLLLTLCMLFSLAPMSVFADTTDSITVNVTIAKDGQFVTGTNETKIAQTPIAVTDINQNGGFDIDDVLYAAHEMYYNGGAENGYASASTEYGLSLTKLWGDESGAFGYYKDNKSPMSLADTVSDGESIYAFVYKDSESWSDTYTYFEASTATVKKGQSLSVKLNKLGYDENWISVVLPVSDATITIDGNLTEYKTNAEGIAEIKFEDIGSYTLSAITDYNSTPPVSIVNVTESDGEEIAPPDDEDDPSNPQDPEKKDYLIVIPEALEKIAATYKNSTSEWIVMDMGAYEGYAPETENKLNDEAKQKYVNYAIKTIKDATSDTSIAKAALGLAAISKNPELLYSVNSNTPVSAIERLNGVTKSASAWSAPFILAVYNQGDYDTEDYETEIVNAILSNQEENGSWNEFGTIDTTANVIAGLSFYKEREEVSIAIDKAINYLSTQQNTDGTFSDNFSGANSNSTAMVIIALSAAGVDLIKDTRFIKNDKNIIDGLLSFLVADGNGFGHTNNESVNAGATEQAFRALIAFMNVVKTNEAYNVYDFSKNEFTPARATSNTTSSSDPFEPSGDDITVTVTIKADTGYWLNNCKVSLPGEGATVYHAFVKACSNNSITYEGAKSGYVISITKGNKTLAEFDKGENSGWLYKVNDELPSVSLTDYSISNGDKIVWYYTEDWTRDPSAVRNSGGLSLPSVNKNNDKNTEEKDEEEIKDNEPTEDIKRYEDVKEDDWYYEAVKSALKAGLFKGVSEISFAPNDGMTRAMLVTVLYRLENPIEKAISQGFSDVKAGEWYADAVNWAAENGIVNGVSEGEFAPNKNITREQIATVLYRYAQYKEQDTSIGENTNILSYEDAEEISEYAISAMQWMVGAGLMNGETESTINPKNNSTRAQVATIFMRYLEM